MTAERMVQPVRWERVALGGLVAGVILILVQMVFHYVHGGPNWWFFRALKHPIAGAPSIIRYAGLHFISGVMAIYLYAAVRPRYGPGGPKTAAAVGVVYWVIRYAIPTIDFYPLLAPEFTGPGWVSGWWIGSAVELAGIILAILAGAFAYKEH